MNKKLESITEVCEVKTFGDAARDAAHTVFFEGLVDASGVAAHGNHKTISRRLATFPLICRKRLKGDELKL